MKKRPYRFVLSPVGPGRCIWEAPALGLAINALSKKVVQRRLRKCSWMNMMIWELVPRPDLGISDGKGGIRKPRKGKR